MHWRLKTFYATAYSNFPGPFAASRTPDTRKRHGSPYKQNTVGWDENGENVRAYSTIVK